MFCLKMVTQKAFTLAEVLIALVIIGVVAAITVPTIMQNQNDKALRVALRKSHSVIAQAMNRYYIDNGEHVSYDTDLYNNFFLKYFNVATSKIDSEDLENTKYQNYSRKNSYVASQYYFSSEDSVILTDGMMMGPYLTSGSYNVLGVIVDVNGPYKKPNRLGKDTFFFEIYYERTTKNTIIQGEAIPGGTKNKSFMVGSGYCSTTSGGVLNGLGCTSQALYEK